MQISERSVVSENVSKCKQLGADVIITQNKLSKQCTGYLNVIRNHTNRVSSQIQALAQLQIGHYV